MKNLQVHRLALILSLAFHLDVGQATDTNEALESEVLNADATYWKAAFNECDLKKMSTLITDDFEFFHDVIGIVRGERNFVLLTGKNMCNIPGVKLRREAITGTVSIELLRNIQANNKVYGAVVSGSHRFFASEKGTPEVPEGQGKFVHVMLLKGKAWKLARAISYSHGPAQAGQEQVPQ